MRILDLRPRAVRFISRLWRKGPAVSGHLEGNPRRRNPLLRSAAALADGFMVRRVAGRSLDPAGPFIVSVGNLALGGTGKTPVVGALATALAAAGRKGAVLTRGFGSPLAGPLDVAADNPLAGDEARLLTTMLSGQGWPVVQARRRVRGLVFLAANHPDCEVVVVEDGHQTAALGRHLDVVILDAWSVTGKGPAARVEAVTGPVFPFGPWRESAAGASRAQIWLLESDREMPAEGVGGQAVARFQRSLTLRSVRADQDSILADGRFAVLSGIARPEAFEQALRQTLPEKPVLTVRCGDHDQYLPRRVETIQRAVRGAGADFLVTTAKDWVKLEPFWPDGPGVLVADLQIRWVGAKTLPDLVAERLSELPVR